MSMMPQVNMQKLITKYKPYPAYRPSGVEWLGDIPAHWEVRRLKYLATVNDEALPATTDPDMEMTYVDIGNVDLVRGITGTEDMTFEDAPSRARRIVRQGDIVISTVRTYLKAIARIESTDTNLIVSTGFAVIRPNHLHDGFVAYALGSPYFVERVVAHSVGVSYPAINAGELACLDIAFPPLPEQQAIADFLDRETARIDALVAKKEQLIELLQEKRTALITSAVTRGLDPSVKMKDSGVEWLGKIPAHWEVAAVKHKYAVQLGKMLQNNPIGADDVEVPYLKALNVQWFDVQTADPPTMWASQQEVNLFGIRKGDLLVCEGGAGGRSGIIGVDVSGYIIQNALHRVRPIRDSRNDYLQYILSAITAVGWFDALNEKATIAHFTGSKFAALRIPLPPLPEQRAIAALLDRDKAKLDALIDRVQDAIDRLRELRTALISAAVTGQIDVRQEVV